MPTYLHPLRRATVPGTNAGSFASRFDRQPEDTLAWPDAPAAPPAGVAGFCDQCGGPFGEAAGYRTFHLTATGTHDPDTDRHHAPFALEHDDLDDELVRPMAWQPVV